jgi:uncharacterized membrane protein
MQTRRTLAAMGVVRIRECISDIGWAVADTIATSPKFVIFVVGHLLNCYILALLLKKLS